MTQRHDEDVADLEKVLDSKHLKDGEEATFTRMLEWVSEEESRSLSEKQRDWLQKALARSKEDRAGAENLFSRGVVAPAAYAPLDELLAKKGPLRPPPRKP